MTNFSNYCKMNYLIELLHQGNIGGTKELAKHLNVSERTVKRKLRECKELGYNV